MTRVTINGRCTHKPKIAQFHHKYPGAAHHINAAIFNSETEAEWEEKEAELIRQVEAKEIDDEWFRELVNELDLERAMAESVAEGPATTQATTQDGEVGESEREESAGEGPAAAEVVVESSTVGKGKAAPARAKVYAAVDGPVSRLFKSTSIRANT
jgi:hypothetical protein